MGQLVSSIRFVEQVLSPGLVRSAKVAHDLPVDVQGETARPAQQVHPGFFRSPVALSMIAAFAAGYQIIPCRLPSTRARKHMIES